MAEARILTTHVGSLPRPEALLAIMRDKVEGRAYDAGVLDQSLKQAVTEIVRSLAGLAADDDEDVVHGRIAQLLPAHDESALVTERLDRGVDDRKCDAGERRGGVGDDHAERHGGGEHQRHRDDERRLRRLRHGARRRQPGLRQSHRHALRFAQ